VTKGSCAMRGLLHDPFGLFEALRKHHAGPARAGLAFLDFGKSRTGTRAGAPDRRDLRHARRLRRRGTASGAPALVPQTVDAIAFGAQPRTSLPVTRVTR
jgi:hypothetical protein